MKLRAKFFLLLNILLIFPAWASAAKLTDIHVATNAISKNLVLEVDNNINYRWFVLKNPDRLVIDLDNTKLLVKLNTINFAGTPIRAVRAGTSKTQALRLVFELSQPLKLQVSTQLLLGKNKQIIIHLLDKPVGEIAAKIPITPVADELKPTAPTMSSSAIGHRKVVVVIDPGHGGKDPGAIGVRGTREKDVVLAISKNLANLLNSTPGYSGILTRDGDYFIELRQRMKLARKDKADMFIAVHADAFINNEASGSSVFALSAHGASSEAARWLAERENYSELGGVNLNQLNDKNNMLRSVLIDLSQNATIGASLQLGSALIHSLGQINKLHRGRVEQAPFMVLKSPDIPSVLVETGFLSNYQEEQNLRSPAYQQQVARAMYQGIMNYFQQNPPEGSYIAANTKPQSYIVARGDTVASVAQRFKTTVAALKTMNNLSSNTLTLGQTLLIPVGR